MRRVVSGVVGLFGLGTWVFGGGMLLLLVARRLFGERMSIIAWANNFLHVWLLPALPLLVLTTAARQWRKSAVLLLPALFTIRLYRRYFGKRPPVDLPPTAVRFRLLTFNLLGKSSAEITAIIRAANADLVAVQELSDEGAARLCEDLFAEYPYMLLHPKGTPNYYVGMGFLSRHPIIADEYRLVGLGQQRVEVHVNGEPLIYFNVHTEVPFAGHNAEGDLLRTEHVRALLDWAAWDAALPLVISGDFNMTELTEDYKRMTVHYDDAYQKAGRGFGFTFPSYAEWRGWRRGIPPLARLDYVFTNAHLLPLAMRVWSRSGDSDHRPVVAEIAFQP